MSRAIVLSVLVLLAQGIEAKAETWQQTLQSKFDIVETFDELQDWGAKGLSPSGAGGAVPYDPVLLPKKLDGTPSIWGYWNNKTPTAIVGPISNGSFATGEVIGNGKGALLKHQKTHVIDGVTYLQMGWVTGSTGQFLVGDTLRGQTSGATAVLTGWPKIIANHGANSWKGSGKSLLMNLGDNDNTAALAGVGAQRLGTFFGNGITGKSGYRKIHVFMMIKFAPKFFGLSGAPSDINYVSVFKFFDICSGFTSINRFGSDADQPFIEQGNPQVQIEYGANDSIFNLNGGGLTYPGRAFFTENIGTAMLTPDSNPPTYYAKTTVSKKLFNNDSSYPANGTDVNRFNPTSAGGEWFGIEVMSDIGTLGNADALTEFWVYDKLGNVRGHYLATGQSKLLQFDHLYNKITLGGNRRTGTGSTGLDGRYWIDDFIVDGARIGPTYFQSLSGVEAPDTAAPTVSITAPTANSSVRGITEVSASALDNVAVTKVEFYLNGTLLGTDSVSPFAVAWNTGSSPSGSYTLEAKAYDAAGNVGQSAIVPVSVTGVDATAPVITAFTMPLTATSRTVAVTLSASDAVGVTGYLISESATTPLAGAAGWLTIRPTSFTFAGTGARTAYAWVKDAAGNVSAPATARVTITLPDTTIPVVISFTMPAASKTLTVPITALTGSDNVGVKGYLVTQSSLRPLASATGWSATPPTQFTFSAFGIRTAYAWVKDAAGNVSSYRSAQVTVDSTAPVITSFVPVAGTYPFGTAIRIAGTATDAIAISQMRISVDGTYKSTAAGGSISYYWTPTSRGSHVFRLFAYDRAGNYSVRSVYVTIQ